MIDVPDSTAYGANMGPTWGWQDPGDPHVGPMNLAIWDTTTWNQSGLCMPYDDTDLG